MAFYLICLVALLGVALGDGICPAPADLKPCTCDGEGVNCMEATSLEEIKRAFNVKFKYGETRAVWVQGTPITSLPADTFGPVKSQQFYVEVNAITSVDLNAFRASKSSMNLLSMFGNKLTDFPFNQLGEFKVLSTLNLARNKIEAIPKNAFNSRSLWVIILAQNQIKTIGANAFAKLPSLGRLDLSINQITTLGPTSMAMIKHSDTLQINLSENQISQVDATSFLLVNPQSIFFTKNKLTSLKKAPFQALITKAARKGGFIEVSNNPLTCQGCDFSWIALNKDLLTQVLFGFKCSDGKTIRDLTKFNIGCR